MKKKRVAVLGTFDFGKPVGGQQVKTQEIGNELKREFGAENVCFFDAQGKWKFVLRLPWVLLQLLSGHQHIVFMLADKGIRVVVPPLVLMNRIFHRSLHYVVIGGWLPSLISTRPVLAFFLRQIDHIYVETTMMSEQLKQMGFHSLTVMPNCKQTEVVKAQQLPHFDTMPFPLCTFSRVIKSKGIEDAIAAVNSCNQRMGKTVYTLDIYGMIQEKEWFDDLMNRQSSTIRYCGMIPYHESTKVLHKYFALVFPTFYEGEGFAGTIIDAMAAGLPAIVSDWKFNKEIITEGKTGYIFPTHSVEILSIILWDMAHAPQKVDAMRPACIEEAKKYQLSEVIKVLSNNIR